MFRRYYQLVCDECEKESEIAPIETFVGKWHFDEFMQSVGYRFYSLTCSKECQEKQKTLFTSTTRSLARGEIPLELAVLEKQPTHQIGFPNWEHVNLGGGR